MLNWPNRPSPAMLVACLALIVAVGGGTLAVAKKGGGKKINGAKLKKRSVPAGKLKKHTITGNEVNLNKLGKVPSAKAADTAGSATSATSATSAGVAGSLATLSPQTHTKLTSSGSGPNYDAAREAAAAVTVYEDSHFRLYAKCFTDTGESRVYGVLLIASKQNGAIFDASSDELAGDPKYLDVATPEEEREIDDEYSEEDEAAINEADQFGATAADGFSLLGNHQIATKRGTIGGGDGLYGPGEVCLFDTSAYHS